MSTKEKEKIDIFWKDMYIDEFDGRFDSYNREITYENLNKDLLIKVKYLKDKNRLDLINSCPENLLMCILPGDTVPLINYFNKDKLPKINEQMNNLEIIFYKYYEQKELSSLLGNISIETLFKEKFKDFDTLFEFFLKDNLDNKNKLNEIIKFVNEKKYLLGAKTITTLAKYNIYLPKKNSKMQFNIKKSINDFLSKNYDEKIYNNEENELVNRFYNLFSDSDEDIVKLAINSFYHTYSFDKDRAIRDIKLLMQYKENNSNFKLSYHSSRNCFTKEEIHNPYSGLHLNAGITISRQNDIIVFDHELGHFLYEFLDIDFDNNNINNSSCPNDILDSIYDEIIKLYYSLDKKAHEEYLKYIVDIDEYKNKLRQEFMESYNKNNNDYIEYISSLIDDFQIIDKNDLCEFYINNKIIKEKKVIYDELFKKKYASLLRFFNFINDYYNGWFNTKRKLKNNLEIPIETYSNECFLKNNKQQIHELFANFTALLRDKDGRNYINKLRKICSSEFIDSLYDIDSLISNNYLNTINNKKHK